MNKSVFPSWKLLLLWVIVTVIILIAFAFLLTWPGTELSHAQGLSPLATPILSVRSQLPIIRCDDCLQYTLTPTPRATLPAPTDTPIPTSRPTLPAPSDTPSLGHPSPTPTRQG